MIKSKKLLLQFVEKELRPHYGPLLQLHTVIANIFLQMGQQSLIFPLPIYYNTIVRGKKLRGAGGVHVQQGVHAFQEGRYPCQEGGEEGREGGQEGGEEGREG